MQNNNQNLIYKNKKVIRIATSLSVISFIIGYYIWFNIIRTPFIFSLWGFMFGLCFGGITFFTVILNYENEENE